MIEFLRRFLGLAPQLSVLSAQEFETERAQRAAKRARSMGPEVLTCFICHKNLEDVQRAVYTRVSRYSPKTYYCATCMPKEYLQLGFLHVCDKFDDVSRSLADAQEEVDCARKKINALEAANGMCEACEEKRTPCLACATRPATIACVPCGHCVVCDDACSVRLFPPVGDDAKHRCPMCRTEIVSLLKIRL